MHHPPLPPGPGLSLPVAVGALLRPPELLRPRPNRYLVRRVEPLAGERRPPHPSQAPSRPGSRRSGPDAGNPEMLKFALSQETARTTPLLSLVEGREENLPFMFCHWSKGQRYPLSQERAISFSSGFSGPWDDSVRRPASSLSPTTHFASSQESTVRGRHSSPRSVWDPGSSVRISQNAPPSVPSTPTPFRCTTTGMSIVPLEPLAQGLEAWLTPPSLSRWLKRTIRQAHYQMHPAPGLVCSDRPEGCLLSCFDPSATQTVPTVCV